MRKRTRALAIAAVALGTLWACTDQNVTGPLARAMARLVMPVNALPKFAIGGVGGRIDTVRIVLTRPPSTAAIVDTSIFVPVGADSLNIPIPVSLIGGSTFQAVIEYRSGGVVLFSGIQSVVGIPDGVPSPPPVTVPVTLVGPGHDVVAVSIAPRDTAIPFGGSATYRLLAKRPDSSVVSPFIYVLTTNDQTVPISTAGVIAAPATRKTIWVKILVPGLQPTVADSTRITFTPVPTVIVLQSGGGQSGAAGALLGASLVARVNAADGLGVPGAIVTFAAVSAGASVTTPTSITDANGDARTTVTLGPLAGPQSFTATASVGSVTFNETATAAAPASIAIVAGDARVVPAGTPVDIAPQVRVTDGFGNPAPGATVTFSVLTGGGSVAGGTVTTSATGLASVGSWTLGVVAGPNTLRAAVAGVAPITFSATGIVGPAASLTIVSGNGLTLPVASVVATLPTVKVTDAVGNPVSGVAVNFSGLTGGGSATGTTPTTNAAGQATLGSWTLGTVAGPNSITATAGALTPVTFTNTATPGPAAVLAKAGGDARTAVVGTPTDTAPTVKVTDAFGNGIAGATVTFGSLTGGGSIAGSPATTNAAGVAKLTSWTLGAAAGPNTVTASSGALTPVVFTATGTAAAPVALVKTAGDAQTATVNAAVAIAPQVRLVDAGSNPVAGVTITFTVLTGGGSVTGATAVTNAAGLASVGSWTLGTITGGNTLRASGGGVPNVTFTATGAPGAPVAFTKVSGDARVVQAGTVTDIVPTVKVADSFGNGVAGVVVTFGAITGGGSTTGATPTTDAFGNASLGSWTLGATPGPNTLTASSAGLTSLVFTATGTAGPPSSLIKFAGDAQSATVNTAVAGAVQVKLVDGSGNPIGPGTAVTFAVATGGGSITGATPVTNAAGIATLGSWTLGTAAGGNSITATSAGVSPVTFTATGTPGAPTTIVIVAGDAQSAAASSAVAIPPLVKVQDSFSNGVPGQTVTFAVAAGGGSVTGATPTTNAAGQAAVGSWTLGASLGLNQLTASSGALTPVTFNATAGSGAPATLIKFAGDGQSASVFTAVPGAVQVKVVDGGGNPVAGVTVTFGSLTGGGIISGTTPVTNAAGIATLGSWTLGAVSGTNTVTASAAGVSSVVFAATGTPDPASTMTKVSGDAQGAVVNSNVLFPLQVRLTDGFGNGVPGVVVTFTVTGGGGSLTGATPTTTATGHATLGSWKLGTVAGANTLTASASGVATVTFTATGTAGTPASIVLVSTASQTATVGTAVAAPPTVRVLDAFGNPVPGVSVVFAVSAGGGSVAGTPVTTDVAGLAQVGSWTLGTGAGLNSVTASVSGVATPAQFDATGTAGAPTTLTNLAGDGVSVTVGQSVLPPPKLLVRDAFGNPVAGVAVDFVMLTVGNATTGASTFTNAAGQATIGSWTINVTGTNVLVAHVNALTSNFTVTGVSGGVPHLLVVSGDGQFAKPGTILPTPIVIRAVDGAGAPVAGVGIAAVVAGPSGGSIGGVGGGFVTNGAGIVSIDRFRLGTAPGTNALLVSAVGYTSVTAFATGVGLPVTLSQAGGDNQVAPAGSALPLPINALVIDGKFQPVPGEVVTFTIVTPSVLDPAHVVTRFVLTDNAGVAALSLVLDTMPGVTRVTASVRGTSPVSFIATGTGLPSTLAPFSIRTIVGATGFAVLGAAPTDPISFVVLDSLGRPVTGAQVDFTSKAPEESTPRSMGFTVTGPDGIATLNPFVLYGDTPGPYNIAGTVHLTTLKATAVVFAADVPAQIEILDGDNQTGSSGTNLLSPVQIRVVDAQGNLIPGVSVAWITTGPGLAPGSTVTTGIGHATTDASGQAVVTWRLGPVDGQNKMVLSAGAATITIFATGVSP